MVGSPGAGALPRRASIFLLSAGLAACVALAVGAFAFPRGIPRSELIIVLGSAALATSVMFFLQTRSLTFPWAGERIAIHPDEAVILVAIWFLPPGVAVSVAAGATLVAQLTLRKPLTKAAFNAATVTLSAGLASFTFTALLAMGLPPVLAIAPAPFIFAAASQGCVAMMLTLIADRPLRDAFSATLARSIAISAIGGVLLGGLTIALMQVHWLALSVVVGLGLIFLRAMAAEYRHETELAARRALHRAMDRLAGNAHEEDIVYAVYEACREAFPLREFQVQLAHRGRQPRTWTLPAGTPSKEPVAHVRVPLVSASGSSVGMLTLTVVARGTARLKDDEELAGVYAGYLAAAVGQAEALAQVAEAKQRLADVFDAAPDPIIVVGADGVIVQENLAATTAFGVTVPVIDENGTATSADGRLFEFAASRVNIEGGGYGAILLGRDVTERRRAEELLRRNERLSSLGTLVAGVAHEVNNPLMYIQGHLEIALNEIEQDAPDRAELREALETALKGAKRIEFIARGLKAVVRSQPGRQEPIPVNRIVDEVANLVRIALPTNVALLVDLDPSDPVVQGDPHELHQVVVNLARNAVDAVRDNGGGTVTLATSATGSLAEIQVRDDGPGVPEDARAKLFTPFYTTKSDGTGLGLAITLALVQAHRGELLLDESEPGKGATFRVRIPRPLLAMRTP